MRLLAFVYDFPHAKSCRGLHALEGLASAEVLVLAAPRVVLPRLGRASVEPAGASPGHPQNTALELGHRYLVAAHDSVLAQAQIHRFRPELAIILGARKLSAETLEAVASPVVNVHPGVLPGNRGLDSVAWAAVLGLPQGAALHRVTRRLDAGPVISLGLLGSVRNVASVHEGAREVDELGWSLLRQFLAGDVFAATAGSVPCPWISTYHSRLGLSSAGLTGIWNAYRLGYAGHLQEWWHLTSDFRQRLGPAVLVT